MQRAPWGSTSCESQGARKEPRKAGGDPGACLPLHALDFSSGGSSEMQEVRTSSPALAPGPRTPALPTTQHILLSTLKPGSTGGTPPQPQAPTPLLASPHPQRDWKEVREVRMEGSHLFLQHLFPWLISSCLLHCGIS